MENVPWIICVFEGSAIVVGVSYYLDMKSLLHRRTVERDGAVKMVEHWKQSAAVWMQRHDDVKVKFDGLANRIKALGEFSGSIPDKVIPDTVDFGYLSRPFGTLSEAMENEHKRPPVLVHSGKRAIDEFLNNVFGKFSDRRRP